MTSGPADPDWEAYFRGCGRSARAWARSRQLKRNANQQIGRGRQRFKGRLPGRKR